MKKIHFTSFDSEKFTIENVPDDAFAELIVRKDGKDGEIQQLIVRQGLGVIATFSSIVSFYEDTLTFTQLSESKDFI